MIKNTYYTLFFIFVSLTFTSCFEIIEEIDLNTNGSGKFEFTANMSQSKNKIASLMLLDSVNGHKIPSVKEIEKRIIEVTTIAKNTEGLSGVKITRDYSNYIFSFTCTFNKLENINAVISELQKIEGVSKKQKPDTTKHFSFNTNTKIYTRNGNYSIAKSYDRLKSKDRDIFDNASYTCITRFNSEIKNFDNKKTMLAPSKKAAMLKLPAQNLINQTQSLSNTITLK